MARIHSDFKRTVQISCSFYRFYASKISAKREIQSQSLTYNCKHLTVIPSRNFKKLSMIKLPKNAMIVSRITVKQKRISCDELPDVADNSQYISFVFEYQRSSEEASRIIRLQRPSKEKFSKTLQKLRSVLVCNTLQTMSFDLPYRITVEGRNVFSPELIEHTNEDIFYNENISHIQIDRKNYRVIMDPPECTVLKLALKPMVGCPIIASFDLLAGRRDPSVVKFHWFVASGDVTNKGLERFFEAQLYTFDWNSFSNVAGNVISGWEFRYTGVSYVPEKRDVGKFICVVLDLGEDAILRSATAREPIADCLVEPLIFEERQSLFCSERFNEGLRIMSYNVLADLYMNLRLPQEELFYPYCPKEYQEYPYRYSLLLREIPGYKADLIFLQEVDERFRRRFLSMHMQNFGYRTYFKKKGCFVNEGLAICIREDKLRIDETHDIWLPELLDEKAFPENKDIVFFFDQNPDCKKRLITRPAVIQLLSLKLISCEGTILVGNTHLHYDPSQEHIKVLQALLCARYIARTASKLKRKYPNSEIYKIFAGDFNSTPNSPVYQLFSKGSLSKDDICWKSASIEKNFAEIFSGGPILTNLEAMSSLASDPIYSNYTLHSRQEAKCGFAGCLDYMWGDAKVKISRIIPMPQEGLLKKYVALPSKISASDHLPIICDIQLKLC